MEIPTLCLMFHNVPVALRINV